MVIERLEVRTEVTGLRLELVSYQEPQGPVLKLLMNEEVVFHYALWPAQFNDLKELFLKKDEPGQNFFDHVQALVEQSSMRGVRTT